MEKELSLYRLMITILFFVSLAVTITLVKGRNDEVKRLKSEIANYKQEVNDYKSLEQKYKKALILSDYLFDVYNIWKTDKTSLLEDYLKAREDLNDRMQESKSSELIDILSEQYNQ